MYSTRKQELFQCLNQIQIKQRQLIQDFLKKYDYVYEREISKGHFNIVVQAKSANNHNCKVAIQILNYEYNSKINVEKLNKQLDFQDSLSEEKYILKFIQLIQDQKYGFTAIITEYCEATLAQVLEQNNLTITQVYALAYQLIKGLILLQEKDKVLKYIEPNKIFYSISKNQFLLTSINISQVIDSQYDYDDQQLGNLNYQSPEVIDKNKPYKITADVFSIGVILLEALLQRKLKGMEYLNLKTQNLISVFPDLPNQYNDEFVTKVLSKMVEPNLSKRSYPLSLLQELNKFKIDEQQLKLINIQQNMETQDIEPQDLDHQENIFEEENVSYVEIEQENKQKDKKNKKDLDQNIYEEENVSYEEIEQENQEQKNKKDQKTKSKKVKDSNIQEEENFSYEEIEKQSRQKDKKNKDKMKDKKDLDQNISEQENVSYEEIEQGNQQQNNIITKNKKALNQNSDEEENVSYVEIEQIDKRKDKKNKDKKQNKKDLDQNISEEENISQVDIQDETEYNSQEEIKQEYQQEKQKKDQKNQKEKKVLIKVDIKQLILNLILKFKITKNKIQIQKYNDCLIKNAQVQNDLNLLIQQLKQDNQKIIKNFHIEDCQPFYEKDDDDYQKQINIIDIKQIPQQYNYGIVEIELKDIGSVEEEIMNLVRFLKECQKMRFLSLNVEFYYHYHNSYEYLKRTDMCQDLLCIQLNLCFNLVNLISLNLKLKTHFVGEESIGNLIGRCKNLCFLKLDLTIQNSLGSICQEVPQRVPNISQGLAQCQNLVDLDLRLYGITTLDILDIAYCLTQIQNLNFLSFNLRNCQIIQRCHQFVNHLKEFKNIIVLKLDFNSTGMNYNDLIDILQSFQSLEYMKFLELDLSSNKLNYTINETQIEDIVYKSLTHLTLDLSINDLNQNQINNIIKIFKSSENLNSLHLNARSNVFKRGEEEENICFEKLKNLTHLSMISEKTFCIISNSDCIDMSFYKCKKLISLDLAFWFSQINNEDLNQIGLGLQKCSHLKSLKLLIKGCQLGKVSLEEFGKHLSQCVNINSLQFNFSKNNIGLTHAQVIGQILSNLQNLTELNLNLSGSQIRQKGTNFIAQGIEKCKHLTSLSLNISNSMVTVNAIKQLAQSLKQNKKIISLDLNLDGNKLSSEAINSINMVINDHLAIKNLSLSFSQNNFDRISFYAMLNHLQKFNNLQFLQIICKGNLISSLDKENFEKEVKQNCLSLKIFKFIY